MLRHCLKSYTLWGLILLCLLGLQSALRLLPAQSQHSTSKPIAISCHSPVDCRDRLWHKAQTLAEQGRHAYAYGASGQNGHYDCSAFVLNLIYEILPEAVLARSSQDIFAELVSPELSQSDWEHGDLLFFRTDGIDYNHVGMYWGQDLRQQPLMLHISSSRGIEIIPFLRDSYWKGRLQGAKRYSTLHQALNQ